MTLKSFPALRVVPELVSRAVYVAVTAPLLLCTDRRLQLFGLALLVSSVISQLVFWYAYYSVWCMFAALLSFYMCVFYHFLPDRMPRLVGRELDPNLAIGT